MASPRRGRRSSRSGEAESPRDDTRAGDASSPSNRTDRGRTSPRDGCEEGEGERRGLCRRLAARVGRAGDRRAGEARSSRRSAPSGDHAGPRRPECPRPARRPAPGRRLRGQRVREMGRRPLAAGIARRARRPRGRAALSRGGADRPRLAHRKGPSRAHPCHRRTDAPLRIAGNALAVCCRLGMAEDPRVRLLAESLMSWQWPDGGWNCDKRASGYRFSFNESLAPMWGLHEYWVATGRPRDARGRQSDRRALPRAPDPPGARHRRADPRVVRHYPLTAVLALRLPPGARRSRPHGPRGRSACGRRHSTCSRSGGCPTAAGAPADAGGGHPGSEGSNVEMVEWGSGPNELVTLNALRVAGRDAA